MSSFTSRLLVGWRIERRPDSAGWASIAARLVAVALALAIAGVAITLSGLPAGEMAQKVVVSTLGRAFGLQQVGLLATPIILTGVAVALAMKMHVWNLGAEGQLYLGAWAATAIGIHVKGDTAVMLVAMFLAAALAGALWALIPALGRAYANANEILTTLMLNYVAILLVNYFATGPWNDRPLNIGLSYKIPYDLPPLWGQLPIGILVGPLLAVILQLVLRHTRWGYEIATIGSNRRAAEFAGMPVARQILTVMLISGAIAGVAGMITITGTGHRLSGQISEDFGFTGVIVAALAGGSPVGCILTGVLLAVLFNGGVILRTQGLSINAVFAINGMILLRVAMAEATARYRLVRVAAATPSADRQTEGGASDG
jgi:ABC-type uncharacterized transport system permease subunit